MSTNLNKFLSFLLSEATSYEDFIGDTRQPAVSEEENKREEILQLLDKAISIKLLSPNTLSYLKIVKYPITEEIPEELLAPLFKEIQRAIGKHLSILNQMDIEINSIVGNHGTSSEEDVKF